MSLAIEHLISDIVLPYCLVPLHCFLETLSTWRTVSGQWNLEWGIKGCRKPLNIEYSELNYENETWDSLVGDGVGSGGVVALRVRERDLDPSELVSESGDNNTV